MVKSPTKSLTIQASCAWCSIKSAPRTFCLIQPHTTVRFLCTTHTHVVIPEQWEHRHVMRSGSMCRHPISRTSQQRQVGGRAVRRSPSLNTMSSVGQMFSKSSRTAPNHGVASVTQTCAVKTKPDGLHVWRLGATNLVALGFAKKLLKLYRMHCHHYRSTSATLMFGTGTTCATDSDTAFAKQGLRITGTYHLSSITTAWMESTVHNS